MEWNWLQSLFFGFVSGFTEFLPVSADAHQLLFACLAGAGQELPGFRLICRIISVIALVFACRPQLRKLTRERRIAAAPAKRRKRQPDRAALADLRVLRIAAIPLIAGFALYLMVQRVADSLAALSLSLVCNGVILFLPQLFPKGNKASRTMSALDGLLMGLAGVLGVLPGISRVGALTAAGRIRGGEESYIWELVLLLSIPALIALAVFDLYAVAVGSAILSVSLIFQYFLAAAAAFLGTYSGILLMRFLAFRIGFSGFACYSWGAALFTFVLYLTI